MQLSRIPKFRNVCLCKTCNNANQMGCVQSLCNKNNYTMEDYASYVGRVRSTIKKNMV